MTRVLAKALIAAAVAGLGACSGPIRPGSATPEAAVERARTAAESRDWKSYFLAFDPLHEEYPMSSCTIYVHLIAATDDGLGDEAAGLYRKHGVPKPQNPLDPAFQAFGVMGAFKDVDRSALFADQMDFIDRNSDRITAEMRARWQGADPVERAGQLAQADVREAKALDEEKGRAILDLPGGRSATFTLVKRQGGWYLAY